jgi:hypothetical protein
MDAPVISALAALAGAAIGGLTSVLASWLTQQTQARAQWIAQDKMTRQKLYKDFIEEASTAYADALQHHEADMSSLVTLYANIGNMRVLSSPRVVESAEKIAEKIVNAYLAPDKDYLQLRQMVNDGTIDILRDFSEACRAEFVSLRVRLFSMTGH